MPHSTHNVGGGGHDQSQATIPAPASDHPAVSGDANVPDNSTPTRPKTKKHPSAMLDYWVNEVDFQELGMHETVFAKYQARSGWEMLGWSRHPSPKIMAGAEDKQH